MIMIMIVIISSINSITSWSSPPSTNASKSIAPSSSASLFLALFPVLLPDPHLHSLHLLQASIYAWPDGAGLPQFAASEMWKDDCPSAQSATSATNFWRRS